MLAKGVAIHFLQLTFGLIKIRDRKCITEDENWIPCKTNLLKWGILYVVNSGFYATTGPWLQHRRLCFETSLSHYNITTNITSIPSIFQFFSRDVVLLQQGLKGRLGFTNNWKWCNHFLEGLWAWLVGYHHHHPYYNSTQGSRDFALHGGCKQYWALPHKVALKRIFSNPTRNTFTKTYVAEFV